MPEAIPASPGGTSAIAIVSSGIMARPAPAPTSIIDPMISGT